MPSAKLQFQNTRDREQEDIDIGDSVDCSTHNDDWPKVRTELVGELRRAVALYDYANTNTDHGAIVQSLKHYSKVSKQAHAAVNCEYAKVE